MRAWKWFAATIVCALAATAAFAAHGVVTTKDGQVFRGEVIEEAETVSVIRPGIRSRIRLSDVSSIRYTLPAADEIRAELKELKKEDVAGRLSLSRRAFNDREYELARSIAMEALAIEPNSREANDMMDLVRRQLLMEARGKTVQAAPRATQRTVGGNGNPGTGLPVKLLDGQDINAIRQAELQNDDAERVRMRFHNDVRRRFVSRPSVDAREFARLTSFQQGQTIIHEGDSQMRQDVEILDEPEAIRGYRKVQRYILSGCATAQCHGSMMAGNFVLFPFPEDLDAAYTNFHLLTKYSSRDSLKEDEDSIFGGSGGQRRMINRQDPAQSLLLQYGLPARYSENPHPAVPGFRAPFADRRDAVYSRVRAWIEGDLRPVDVAHQVKYVSPVEELVTPAPPSEPRRPIRDVVELPTVPADLPAKAPATRPAAAPEPADAEANP